MKKIKVIQVGFSACYGGIESFAMNYNQYLNSELVQVDYINVYDSAKSKDFYITLSSSADVYDLPDYRYKPVSFIRALIKLQKSKGYDVFHYNMNSASFLIPLVAAKIAGIKVIISHAHNSSSDKGPLKEIAHAINRHWIPVLANTYFACSRRAAEWFYSESVLKSPRYFTIYNAVKTHDFAYDETVRRNLREKLKVKKDTVVIGNVARFNPQKNHEFLIKLFAEYHKKNKNSVLLLVGDGPLMPKIREIINKKGLNDQVILSGQVSNVNELMNAMDLFILPSLYEGLPYVGIEAQVNGLPCLFSDSITSELQLTDKVKYESLNKGLEVWCDDMKQLLQIALPRRTNTIEQYDINYSAEELKKIYIRLASY